MKSIMNKPLSFALFAAGIILLIFAAFSGDSMHSGISRMFQGTPDNRTIILIAFGVIALASGFYGLVARNNT
jgi:hypothetical protein